MDIRQYEQNIRFEVKLKGPIIPAKTVLIPLVTLSKVALGLLQHLLSDHPGQDHPRKRSLCVSKPLSVSRLHF